MGSVCRIFFYILDTFFLFFFGGGGLDGNIFFSLFGPFSFCCRFARSCPVAHSLDCSAVKIWLNF